MISATLKAKKKSPTTSNKEKFLVIPIIILILAQMGATGDSSALSFPLLHSHKT